MTKRAHGAKRDGQRFLSVLKRSDGPIKIRTFEEHFREEMIEFNAIVKAPNHQDDDISDEIWILCDSRVLSSTLATGQMLETKHRSQFLKS
ncbi:hypothetical protein TNCV_576251 [Trichonephila clavipes]|nr:hypothetical protein TNCV_576251 [Trichonephila clavipes]